MKPKLQDFCCNFAQKYNRKHVRPVKFRLVLSRNMISTFFVIKLYDISVKSLNLGLVVFTNLHCISFKVFFIYLLYKKNTILFIFVAYSI